METLFPYDVYDPNCPTRQVLDLIADKWTALIIGQLEKKPQRFVALQRQIGDISQKMLTQTLRRLERDGLVLRTVYAEVPPRVEYELTPLGKTLCKQLVALCDWSEANIEAIVTAQQCYDARSEQAISPN